jgi:peptidoglycan-N-acetylglucosamine deacetylase
MRVALTFDAEHGGQPHGRHGAAEAILEVLTAMDVPASFFVQGAWARANPATARRIAGDGHLVGSHSFHHARLPLLSAEGLRADTRQAQLAIEQTAGTDPRPWFRAPYGAVDVVVLAELARLGYRHVGWDVDPGDWKPERTPDELRLRVLEGVRRNQNGAVVLLHAWPGTTLDALPGMVEGLRSISARFVTVANIGAPRWPPSPRGIRRFLLRSPAQARLARGASRLIRGRGAGPGWP